MSEGDKDTQQQLKAKNDRAALVILIVVVVMVGLSFAAVPMYNLFCRVTGFGGTPISSEQLPDHVLERQVKINFVTSTARDMPWQFGAERRSVKINIGQDMLINFKAYNPTNTDIVGTAIYNVTPLKAGKYFHKTQCFCFDRQVLEAGQSANMPVVFYVDPEMDKDPDMQDVDVITLSYTFFKSDSQDLEKAISNIANQ